MNTAQEVFNAEVRGLPPGERLRLAALILGELTEASSGLDVSDAWSDEDMQDATAFSLDSAQATDSQGETDLA